MPSQLPTVLAVLTPPGRGAVATIGVRGPRAIEIVGRRFSPAAGRLLEQFSIGRAVFGRFASGAEATEELVVGLVGPQEVEVHCHGGLAAAEAVAGALTAEGAERIDWQVWARLVELDSIAAEATVALAAARTERAAAILLDQQRGALRREVERIRSLLDSGSLEARSVSEGALHILLARADLGRHLTQPWRVVVAGQPNAGKSSLANAMLGYQRSIVHGEPGTTRDVLTAATAIEGWPVELIDTAGLRAGGDAVESEGVERARQQIADADLVLHVGDVTVPWQAEGVSPPSPRAALIVHNKCDLAPPPADGRPAGIAVSALTGEGLPQLLTAIANRLIPMPPPPATAVPFNERQMRLLRESLDAIHRGEAATASERLAKLLA
jgi:tRNA modification GTPase